MSVSFCEGAVFMADDDDELVGLESHPEFVSERAGGHVCVGFARRVPESRDHWFADPSARLTPGRVHVCKECGLRWVAAAGAPWGPPAWRREHLWDRVGRAWRGWRGTAT